jgi:predicted DNA-binding ribbon-helix-helix protein
MANSLFLALKNTPVWWRSAEGEIMKSAVNKRSIVVNGHKTSVSLENEFWDGLREIADQKATALSALVAQVDKERDTGNLSSAIRVRLQSVPQGNKSGGRESPGTAHASPLFHVERSRRPNGQTR